MKSARFLELQNFRRERFETGEETRDVLPPLRSKSAVATPRQIRKPDSAQNGTERLARIIEVMEEVHSCLSAWHLGTLFSRVVAILSLDV